MGDDAVGEGARYWAFISYSHKDAAFGRRLHRRLEGYTLPRRLVGRTTAQGTVPRRLVPIFRDRDELPAANDLSAEVRAALQASRSLIVVCSRAAAASPWVGREVETFRQLHPGRPVLAVIREGEPAECFPEALRRGSAGEELIEPLAADFRPGQDGEHPGLLKLVAGIVGIGLDELVQRDAQRNLRRVTAITTTALTAMIVMGLLTIFALNARNEAERQRAGAEGLVEFMLKDLRKNLENVGRLDVMTTVNKSALDYYSKQDLARLPPDSLERRATILQTMASDDERRGELARASAELREANRTTAALLAADPNNPKRIFSQAQSEYGLALLDWRRNRFDAAQAGLERYAGLAGRLLAIDPANPDWRMEAGYAQSNLGTFTLRGRGDATGAELYFKRSLAYFRTALQSRPGDTGILGDIADAHGWLADCDRTLRQFGGARENRRQEEKILHALQAKEPKSAVQARNLLGNALGMARIDLDAGLAEAAAARLTATFAEAARLAAGDPEDKKVAKQKIAIGLFLAEAVLAGGHSHYAVADLLADCSTSTAQRDLEITDFCAVLQARAAKAAGIDDIGALDYLRRNGARMQKIAHSPRWGIDFSRELLP